MDEIVASSGLFIVLAFSLLSAFFGYRFFKIMLGLSGAIIAGALTWAAFQKLAPSLPIPAIICSLLMALLGAYLFHKAFKIAAFLYGVSIGVSLTPLIRPYVEITEAWVEFAIPTAAGLICGFLLLISRRSIMIIMTAGSGAMYFAMSLFLLLIKFDVLEETITHSPDTFHSSMWLVAFSICFFSGMYCQFTDKEKQS